MPELLKKGLLLVLILAAGSHMTACGCKPRVVRPKPAAGSQAQPQVIHVANHGWHTGVIIPGREINREMPVLEDRFGDAPYYEFGWGDAQFYQAKEISFRLGVRALCWPTDAVLHVVALPDEPETCFPHSEVATLFITKEGYDSLREFISLSFARNSQGLPRALARGIYGDSHFYRAEGTFFLTNTCNKWTAKALRSAGRDIPVTFSFSAGSIMNHLRRTVTTPAR
ncbi:MAG: TIGR02117 family protein [Desulfobacteraceae bacterium]|nr:TIGR02117 family protein [Desulfobacteraceae bacterium]